MTRPLLPFAVASIVLVASVLVYFELVLVLLEATAATDHGSIDPIWRLGG
ncbi:hypothetical protein [Natrarchaeobaculum sulfurireducens]|nr:hypothetical protein [Natrarchaeobaculum sulfurireducens]